MTTHRKLAGALVTSISILASSIALSGCMTVNEARMAQRPQLPQDRSLEWSPANRLYQSVTLEYIGGMDQRSYLFGKAKQALLRPMLEHVLSRAGLLAPTPLAATA